jgi:hypothetical protein
MFPPVFASFTAQIRDAVAWLRAVALLEDPPAPVDGALRSRPADRTHGCVLVAGAAPRTGAFGHEPSTHDLTQLRPLAGNGHADREATHELREPADARLAHPHHRSLRGLRVRRAGSIPGPFAHCLTPVRPAPRPRSAARPRTEHVG